MVEDNTENLEPDEKERPPKQIMITNNTIILYFDDHNYSGLISEE